MARGPSQPWKKVAEHTEKAFPWVNAAMDAGYDVEVQATEVTADELTKFRQGLFNAAKHSGVSLHCNAKKQADGTYTLTYAVHRKSDGRAYILGKHGTDRTQWPYNPRRPSPRDEAGNRTDIDDNSTHARA